MVSDSKMKMTNELLRWDENLDGTLLSLCLSAVIENQQYD